MSDLNDKLRARLETAFANQVMGGTDLEYVHDLILVLVAAAEAYAKSDWDEEPDVSNAIVNALAALESECGE